LLEGIRNVRELATIRQNFQSIVIFKDSKALLTVPLPGTSRKFILKYSGVAVCGSDLSKVKISERFAVNRVRFIVPRSALMDIYLDMQSVKVYDQRAGIFTSIELEDQNREIAANLEDMKREILESGILFRADENARAILTSLATSMGMESEVVFEEGTEEKGAALVTVVSASLEETSVTGNPPAQPR
jgi:hypothetical protein